MPTTIRIISGSGPEAGLDLYQKVLRAHRAELGADYRGDVDAPRIVLISEPVLGLSMDLERHETDVWAALERTVRRLAPQVDVYAVACNTLNVFADRLVALGLDAELVSSQAVVATYLRAHDVRRAGLLGAAPVGRLGRHSAFSALAREVELVVPDETGPLHQLIHDIKSAGTANPDHCRQLTEIARELQTEPVLLACTELPLAHDPDAPYDAVDVTDLLARELVRRALI